MKIHFLIFTLLFYGCHKKTQTTNSHEPIAIVVKAIEKTLPFQIETFGIAKSNLSVKITAQVTGQLQEKTFIDGDFIQKGDHLYLIDPIPYQAKLQQSQGAVDQSVVNVELAKRTLARFSELAPNDYVSGLDYDKYQFDLLSKQAVLKTNLGQLQESEINLGYCYIHSPISGIIGANQIDVGNYIDQVGTDLITIHQIDPIYVDFNVTTPELMQVLNYSNDQNLNCEIQSEGKTISGHLVFVDNGIDTNTATTLLKARFDNPTHDIYPGQFVNVKLTVTEIHCPVVVPNEAVVIGQQGHYVFLIKESKAYMQSVKTGVQYQNLIEIKTGLKAGDMVVVSGQINLESGKNVQTKMQDKK